MGSGARLYNARSLHEGGVERARGAPSRGTPMTTSSFAYFDCFAGIAGDMTLGALLDAGGSPTALRAGLEGLALDPFRLEVVTVERGGIGATQVKVHTHHSSVVRTWANLRAMLTEADLPEPVRVRALATFERLAEAEARVHRKPADQVHFHEVGAVDAVVDVVGTSLLLHDLGVRELWASAVATGSGRVRTGHGVLPVPGPAVLELLRGAPVYSGGVTAELTTPTGAAILAAGATRFADLPPMRVARIGYGAGSRQHGELPNVLRVVLGERVRDGAAGDGGMVLEANIDDMNPELAPWVLERLLEAGAADVWFTPIHMKRGRPGITLSVLCPPGTDARLRGLLWRETSTLGVRGVPVRKWMLERQVVEVELLGGKVRVKLGLDDGRVVNVAPEFSDCARLATETGQPLKEVMAQAQALALESRCRPAPGQG
jgi:pyridinium-3,5-bisthiocarboxylic acid mononucleotide nickel chelatase